MKTGLSLTEMAQELQRQQDAKRDLITDTRRVRYTNADRLRIEGSKEVVSVDINRNAHRQLATHTGIPLKYYDKMPSSLRAQNVNHWLQDAPTKRLIRTMDDTARAVLSEKYRIIDNAPIVEAVLPILSEAPDLQIVSSHIGEDKFFLKALFPRTEMEVAVGDTVQAGVLISNSEVGNGSFRIEPLVYRLICLNGMVAPNAFKKFHIGRAAADQEQLEYLRDETVLADEKAFLMKVQDLTRASMDLAIFQQQVAAMSATQDWKIEAPVDEVVERTAKAFNLLENERGSVLNHLIEGGSLTGFGLLNAVTKTAHTLDGVTYERSVELERVGGAITELSEAGWKSLAA